MNDAGNVGGLPEKTRLEAVSGSVPAALIANAVAVGASVSALNPIAAFVPVLLQSLATGRQGARVDKALAQLNDDLKNLTEKVKGMSDDQYKVVCEAVSTTLSTIDEAKLEYLRRAVLNVIAEPTVSHGVGDALGRAIRDLSAAEARFIIQHFDSKAIFIEADQVIQPEPGKLVVKAGGEEEIVLSGLIRLGLAYTRSSSWDSSMFEWSPLVAKLIVLLREPSALPASPK